MVRELVHERGCLTGLSMALQMEHVSVHALARLLESKLARLTAHWLGKSTAAALVGCWG